MGVPWAVCSPDGGAPSALSLVARPRKGKRAIGGSVDPMLLARCCPGAVGAEYSRDVCDGDGYEGAGARPGGGDCVRVAGSVRTERLEMKPATVGSGRAAAG